jgi:hypothetical protein
MLFRLSDFEVPKKENNIMCQTVDNSLQIQLRDRHFFANSGVYKSVKGK